jgi:formyl-CoA transferase
MKEREMFHAIPHPVAGPIPNMRLPFRMAGTPVVDPVAAPTLSQHAHHILRDVLGYSDADIGVLADTNAISLPV